MLSSLCWPWIGMGTGTTGDEWDSINLHSRKTWEDLFKGSFFRQDNLKTWGLSWWGCREGKSGEYELWMDKKGIRVKSYSWHYSGACFLVEITLRWEVELDHIHSFSPSTMKCKTLIPRAHGSLESAKSKNDTLSESISSKKMSRLLVYPKKRPKICIVCISFNPNPWSCLEATSTKGSDFKMKLWQCVSGSCFSFQVICNFGACSLRENALLKLSFPLPVFSVEKQIHLH